MTLVHGSAGTKYERVNQRVLLGMTNSIGSPIVVYLLIEHNRPRVALKMEKILIFGLQTRRKGQHKAELTLSPRLYVKPLITVLIAIRVSTKAVERGAD